MHSDCIRGGIHSQEGYAPVGAGGGGRRLAANLSIPTQLHGELVAEFTASVVSSSPGPGSVEPSAVVGSGGGDRSLLDTLTNLSTLERNAALQKKVARAGRRRSERSRIIGALKESGRHKEASRMEKCGRVMPYKCRVCGVVACRRHPWRCGLRVCPHCGQDRAARVGAVMKKLVVTGKISHPVALVLTVRNGFDYAERRQHVLDSFRKLQRLDEFKAAISGGFVFYETTYSPLTGWHPHLNVLADGWIDIRRLVAMWERCTGDSKICWVTRVDPVEPGRAVVELVKYVCKVADIAGSAGLVNEFLEVEHSRRALWAFGKCKGMMQDLAALEKEEAAAEDRAAVDLDCPVCGAEGSMEPREGTAYRTDHLIYPGGWLVRPAQLLYVASQHRKVKVE